MFDSFDSLAKERREEARKYKINWDHLLEMVKKVLWLFFCLTIPIAVLTLSILAFTPLVLPLLLLIAAYMPLILAQIIIALITAVIIGILFYGAFNLADIIIRTMVVENNEIKWKFDPRKLESYFKYMAALVGLIGLFVALILFSPVAAVFSLPMVMLVSVFSAFTFLNAFYRTILYRDQGTSSASMISKRVVINALLFGLLVTLFLFSSLALTFSLPFILVVSAIGALALSRILCEPFVYARDKEDLDEHSKLTAIFLHLLLGIRGVVRMLSKMFLAVVPFFIPLAVMAFFLPPIVFGVALAWPVVLAASALVALAFGRVFFHSLVTFGGVEVYQSGRPLLRSLVLAGSFVVLGGAVFAALALASVPITAPLAFIVLAEAAIGALSIYSMKCRRDLRDPYGRIDGLANRFDPISNPMSHAKHVGYTIYAAVTDSLPLCSLARSMKRFGMFVVSACRGSTPVAADVAEQHSHGL